jgi:K+-transporting ATPase ATPase B chain
MATLITRQIVRSALIESFCKLDPRVQFRNPVMFVVFIGSIFTTIIGIGARSGDPGEGSTGFVLHVCAWLWLTVLFANFAEAVAEGAARPGRDAALDATQRACEEAVQHEPSEYRRSRRRAAQGRSGAGRDGDIIPADGEIIEGVASVNESASRASPRRCCARPVATSRRSRRHAVLSDWIVVRVTSAKARASSIA